MSKELELAEKIGIMSAQIENAAKSMDQASVNFVQHLETERSLEIERNKKIDKALEVANKAKTTADNVSKRQDGLVSSFRWLWGVLIGLLTLFFSFFKGIFS